MADVLTPGAVGRATLDHYEVTEWESRFSAMRPLEYTPPGRYARLRIGGTTVMSDTRMERASNYEFLRRAHGDVLVGGLGLGMIILPACAKPEVSSVTVVEVSSDVIALVEPQVRHPKLTVAQGDVRTWAPPRKFNTIYFDIWPTICVDNLAGIATLHRRYARHLDRADPAVWMGSWMADHLRSERARERARNRRTGW